ncbi:hypothetical protein Q8G35_14905 [Peribacillus simplex]|uniref:Uncharacterized protein n=2 Tax=Peribacillus TaxID=2675229 RepID=A0AA90P2W7_9BACI|nr:MULTISPECIES: hypothetical protein [Peribacillus]MDP1419668.1 hypothetical protein [Peribacillus simplex]MDP1452679.1 hypothetical protein [Peribacillus frigoritolerans]
MHERIFEEMGDNLVNKKMGLLGLAKELENVVLLKHGPLLSLWRGELIF